MQIGNAAAAAQDAVLVSVAPVAAVMAADLVVPASAVLVDPVTAAVPVGALVQVDLAVPAMAVLVDPVGDLAVLVPVPVDPVTAQVGERLTVLPDGAQVMVPVVLVGVMVLATVVPDGVLAAQVGVTQLRPLLLLHQIFRPQATACAAVTSRAATTTDATFSYLSTATATT